MTPARTGEFMMDRRFPPETGLYRFSTLEYLYSFPRESGARAEKWQNACNPVAWTVSFPPPQLMWTNRNYYTMGRVITFSRNVFIPLTTVCRNRCDYCGFRNRCRQAASSPLGRWEDPQPRGRGGMYLRRSSPSASGPDLSPGFLRCSRQRPYRHSRVLLRMCRLAIQAGTPAPHERGVLTYQEMNGSAR